MRFFKSPYFSFYFDGFPFTDRNPDKSWWHLVFGDVAILLLIFVSFLGHYLIISPVLAFGFCVSLCARRDHQTVPKIHWTAILCFVFLCFCVSLCASPDHQIVPKSHWTAINTWRNPRNRPTPICQLQILYSLSGKYDTNTIQSVWEGIQAWMKDGVRQGQGHGCKSKKVIPNNPPSLANHAMRVPHPTLYF